MRIILSPAKHMITDTETLAPLGLPVFLEPAGEILGYLQGQTYEALKKLWGCNDKLARQNFDRLAHMDLERELTPAVLAYDGIAFKYMAPSVFEDRHLSYLQEHLRILSGFYGVLKPMDGVRPYRLEMQAKAKIGSSKDLYEYWGDRLYREVMDESRIIVNLASKEYSRCIEKYLTPEDVCITCVFGELECEKVVQKGVYAKMARGEMVRFMAEHQIEDAKKMKAFDRLGYHFDEKRSTEAEYIFLKD